MAQRYHISPESGRPNICRAGKRPCPIGGEHFDSKEEARAASEVKQAAENNAFSTLTKGDSLRSQEPAQIDGKLAELYTKKQGASIELSRTVQYAERYRAMAEENPAQNNPYLPKAEDMEGKAKEILGEIEKIQGEMEKYDREFERRGGWPRAFLVANKDGHVHKSMNCSTTYATTEFEWMTDYSGASEGEIVEAAGNKACTECYPSAPVEVLNKPSKMFSKGEIAAQREREERERKAEEKRAKAQAAAVTAEDGGPLTLRYYGYEETVKTERAATSLAVDNMIRKRQREISLKEYLDKPELVEKYGLSQYDESAAEIREAEDVLLGAIARKHGVSREIVEQDVFKKAKAKMRREGSPDFFG